MSRDKIVEKIANQLATLIFEREFPDNGVRANAFGVAQSIAELVEPPKPAQKAEDPISQFAGILEINHRTGMIYFHLEDEIMIRRLGQQTLLRIGGLPQIPEMTRQGMIDIAVIGATGASRHNIPLTVGIKSERKNT